MSLPHLGVELSHVQNARFKIPFSHIKSVENDIKGRAVRGDEVLPWSGLWRHHPAWYWLQHFIWSWKHTSGFFHCVVDRLQGKAALTYIQKIQGQVFFFLLLFCILAYISLRTQQCSQSLLQVQSDATLVLNVDITVETLEGRLAADKPGWDLTSPQISVWMNQWQHLCLAQTQSGAEGRQRGCVSLDGGSERLSLDMTVLLSQNISEPASLMVFSKYPVSTY